jgi:hypothetical protein
MKFVASLFTGVLLVSAHQAAAETPPQPQALTRQAEAVAAQCRDWYASSAFDGPVKTLKVNGGLCFNGQIAAHDDQVLADALKDIPADQPFVMVVRSPGGDTATGIAMGEALTGRPVTVAVYQMCGSSCANFILPSGRRKVVLKDALLLYHGSISMDFLNTLSDQVHKQIGDMVTQNPDMAKDSDGMIGAAVEQSRATLAAMVVHQDALLEKQGISPTWFRWMDLFNHMTPAEQATHCAIHPHMIVYPPEVLARFGMRIDAYDGPRSQAEVDAAMVLFKFPPKPMCYWQP